MTKEIPSASTQEAKPSRWGWLNQLNPFKRASKPPEHQWPTEELMKQRLKEQMQVIMDRFKDPGIYRGEVDDTTGKKGDLEITVSRYPELPISRRPARTSYSVALDYADPGRATGLYYWNEGDGRETIFAGSHATDANGKLTKEPGRVYYGLMAVLDWDSWIDGIKKKLEEEPESIKKL